MTRRSRSQRTHRRALLILAAGVLAWWLLWRFGHAGSWQTAGLAALVCFLLVLNQWSAPRRTAAPFRRWEGYDAEPVGDSVPSQRRKPNAVSEAYNTYPGPQSGSSPVQQTQASARALRLTTVTHSHGFVTDGTTETPSRMPPPVPPPIFGNPASRPIVAGMEHTARRGRPQPGDVGPGAPEQGGVGGSQPVGAPALGPAAQATDAPPPWTATPLVEDEVAVSADAASAAAADAGVATAGHAVGQASADGGPAPLRPRLPELTPAERLSLGLGAPPSAPDPGPPTPAARADVLPSLDLLPLPASERGLSEDEILERATLLEETLASFGVEATVVDFSFGPAVTRYELQPAPGVRVNKFTALADDIALALAAVDVRVEAPIPGKSAVGIEVPNKERLAVPLREVLQSPEFQESPSKLTIALGKDNSGHPVVGDLARMPHLLIAGSTGSGKSVCVNAIICSLLFKARPDEVKMLMIDPKMVELSMYNGIPHLIAPVITDVRKAAGYLKGAVKEMEARYELFAAAGVRNIEQYNRQVALGAGPGSGSPRQPLPYIVVFIDELADLMMVAPVDVEDAICRLAQMARACGIHLVIATQSPRVDVITGLIKANIPSRIAFAVSSQVDSRVILDAAGAERLLGRGDMLYHPTGLPKPIRAQGAYISEASVEELVRFVKAQGTPEYTAQEVPVDNGSRRAARNGAEEQASSTAVDEALPEAARIIIEHGHASVSLLQRRLRCNYTKATRLIDQLEAMGLVGPHQGSKPREVLATMATWHELFGNRSGETGSGEPDE